MSSEQQWNAIDSLLKRWKILGVPRVVLYFPISLSSFEIQIHLGHFLIRAPYIFLKFEVTKLRAPFRVDANVISTLRCAGRLFFVNLTWWYQKSLLRRIWDFEDMTGSSLTPNNSAIWSDEYLVFAKVSPLFVKVSIPLNFGGSMSCETLHILKKLN